MKKKLLITGSTFPRFAGDTEPRFVLDLAKYMQEYAEVTVLVPAAKGAKDVEVLEGVKVKRYHYFPIHAFETLCYPGAIVPRIREKKVRVLLVPWLFLSLYYNLIKYKKEYDIVLANWLIPQGIVHSFVHKPYVVVGHGGDVTSLNKRIFKYLKCRCLKRATGVVAVSKPLLAVLDTLYPHAHSAVISMGCDLSVFARKEKKEWKSGKKTILFVGRLAEKKGLTYAIEAMKRMEDARLVIVGDGPLKKKLQQQADEVCAQYGREIVFLGAKSHEELPDIYAHADIFVMPSVTAKDGDKEGFGLVILEAFAAGLPIVASRSGGIVDVVRDGENGCLVEEKNSFSIAEKLNLVLQDRNVYNKMSENAKKTAAEYDYATIAKKYAAFMELL